MGGPGLLRIWLAKVAELLWRANLDSDALVAQATWLPIGRTETASYVLGIWDRRVVALRVHIMKF